MDNTIRTNAKRTKMTNANCHSPRSAMALNRGTTDVARAIRISVIRISFGFRLSAFGFGALSVLGFTSMPTVASAAAGTATFEGDKTSWRGFDRYDFLMDEETLAIKAADAKIRGDVRGQRRCIVVCPVTVADGKPWSWRGCYWDHEPQTEIELLRRGFHIAYITANATLRPDKKWDAWYTFLTETHGLSKKPAFIGMSRGGEYAYTWATANPDKVSCIYADNPGGNREILAKITDLARNDVPLLHVCGSIDPILGRFALPIEAIYEQFGGRISSMIKDGAGHHPHSLRNPKPLADFIEQSVHATSPALPAFAGARPTRTSYYSLENSYLDFPAEGTRVTRRGPLFTACYDRYAFDLPGVEGNINVIVPKTTAPGKPWVFRAEFVDRAAAVDQALLAKGFHIVTGPVPYNADGPMLPHWSAVYKHLTSHGFSAKPVMEGAGGAAGPVYAWAIANPDKVSCIYAENPLLRNKMSRTQPLDNLEPLAKAGVALLHVCGQQDPWLDSQTRVAEKRYKEVGGQITVLIKEGEGHYPLAPKELKPVVDFITRGIQ
jgi:pimeloyl-ACP methyl ester carboxylesterase